MNIDLLFTRQDQSGLEGGLIASENLVKKALGALFDPQTGLMTLEFADMDHMELNIPVEQEFYGHLDLCPQIHFGAVKGGNISQAYQIPIMFMDDPYRTESLYRAAQSENPLMAFAFFVKRCAIGQPVHRADLGNEDFMGCVLGDASPAALEFAPHLARRHALEAAPKLAPGYEPSGPGLGSGGGGRTTRRVPPRSKK